MTSIQYSANATNAAATSSSSSSSTSQTNHYWLITVVMILLIVLGLYVAYKFWVSKTSLKIDPTTSADPTIIRRTGGTLSSRGDVGAMYFCTNKPYAVYMTGKAYRKFYPSTTLLMTCDAGDDTNHGIIAKNLGATKYTYNAMLLSMPASHDMGMVKDWVIRFIEMSSQIKEPWFVLLQENVLFVQPIDTGALKFDVNGMYHNQYLPKGATEILRMHMKAQQNRSNNNHMLLPYGAMAGSVFRTSFFKSLAKRTEEINEALDRYAKDCLGCLFGYDSLLSYLTYYFGGTLGAFPGYTDQVLPDTLFKVENKLVSVIGGYQEFDSKCLQFSPATLFSP